MSEVQLIKKPCPYRRCGSENTTVMHSESFHADHPERLIRYHVQCKKCGTRGPMEHEEFLAIQAWNDLPRVTKKCQDQHEVSPPPLNVIDHRCENLDLDTDKCLSERVKERLKTSEEIIGEVDRIRLEADRLSMSPDTPLIADLAEAFLDLLRSLSEAMKG